jgi:hypothetical protein
VVYYLQASSDFPRHPVLTGLVTSLLSPPNENTDLRTSTRSARGEACSQFGEM